MPRRPGRGPRWRRTRGSGAVGNVRPDEVDVPGDRAGPADDPDVRDGIHRHLDAIDPLVLDDHGGVRTEARARVRSRSSTSPTCWMPSTSRTASGGWSGGALQGAQGVTRGTGGGSVALDPAGGCAATSAGRRRLQRPRRAAAQQPESAGQQHDDGRNRDQARQRHPSRGARRERLGRELLDLDPRARRFRPAPSPGSAAPRPGHRARGRAGAARPAAPGLSRCAAMRHPAFLPLEPTSQSVRLGQRSVEYHLRRSARSRGLRITIDARDGLVVSVPLATRRGWAQPGGANRGLPPGAPGLGASAPRRADP